MEPAFRKYRKTEGFLVALLLCVAIVLENTYTFYGEEKPQTYTTLIDKKKLTFVFVGLEYQNNTVISEGKCKLFK